MRVMFTVSNWKAHYYCMVPVGWALQAAGHEVRFVCPPAQAEAISHSGLLPVPILDYLELNYFARILLYLQIMRGLGPKPPAPLPLHPVTGEPVNSLDELDFDTLSKKALSDYVAAAHRSYDNAVGFARQWRPDLVVHDLVAEEGALAARLLDVPAVYHTTGLIGSLETEEVLQRGPADISGAFPRYGQPAWDRGQIRFMIDPSPSVALPPAPGASRLPVRYVAYNGPGQVPSWLSERSDKPRICIIWGNSAPAYYGTKLPSLRYAIEAATELGLEVVLTANEKQVDDLGELPPSVRALRNFPVHLLLPSCDAVVHHGSANILMTAGVAGVPQLALPVSDEQMAISRRMTATGAVQVACGLTGSKEEIRDALKLVSADPSTRESSASLSKEMVSYPTPADVARSLEKLATTGSL